MKKLVRIQNAQNSLYLFMGILIIFKLCLLQMLPIYAISTLYHDDQMMVNNANSMLNGNWLGEYSQLTLVKGPFFPFFLALSNLLGISFLTAEILLYSFACVAFIMAIRKLIKSNMLLGIIFLILLFNPVTMSTQTFSVIYRNNITPAQVLFVVSAFIAMFLNKEEKISKIIVWAVIGGIALSSLWLTREDGIWIIPFVVVSILVTIIAIVLRYKKIKSKDVIVRCCASALPVVILISMNLIVSTINYFAYGIFTTNELNNSNFTKAMKSIYSVAPSETIQYVSVPRSTINKLYEVSPSMASLKEHMEYYMDAWSCNDRNPYDKQVEDGWFFWGLRDAVAASGYCENGRMANEFYLKLSNEIEAALDNGQLERRSVMPSALMSPWRDTYYEELPKTFIKTLKFVIGFDDMSLEQKVSVQNDVGTGIRLAEKITNNHAIYPIDYNQNIKGWFVNLTNDYSLKITDAAGNVLRDITFQESPDVKNSFDKRNLQGMNVDQARFDINVRDLTNNNVIVYLGIFSDDKLIDKIPLDGNTSSLENEDYMFHLDSGGDLFNGDYSYRINFINLVIKIYQKISWIMFVISIITYLYVMIKMFKGIKRKNLEQSVFNTWLFSTGIILSMIVLCIGVSYNEIASCPSIIYKYLSGAYPLLICFWILPLSYCIDNLIKTYRKSNIKE